MTTALPNPGKAGVEEHVQMSHWLLENARRELDRGDRLQASEKVWGAAAHALKAIGEKRGWDHMNHMNVKDIGFHLAQEFGRDHFYTYVNDAELMHLNFYRNEADMDNIRQSIVTAGRFIAELDEIREQPPRPFTVRDATDQRRLGRLLDIERSDFQRLIPIGSHSDAGFSRNPDDNGGTARNPNPTN
jgi:hypothetical protein